MMSSFHVDQLGIVLDVFWQGGYEKGLNKFIWELLVMEKEGFAVTWSKSFASRTGMNVD